MVARVQADRMFCSKVTVSFVVTLAATLGQNSDYGANALLLETHSVSCPISATF